MNVSATDTPPRASHFQERDLSRLLSPQRIALIGSLSKQQGLGSRTLRHLMSTGFEGEILQCRTASDVDDGVDLAIVAVPSDAAPGVVAELDGRAAFVVVYSSGFEEVGAGRLPRPQRGTTVIGPNSAGLYYGPGKNAATFAAALDSPMTSEAASGVFLIAQSGAFGSRLLESADHYGVAFDGFIATGNGSFYDPCDIATDLLESSEHKPRVLAFYLESVPDIQKFESMLTGAGRAGVPVIVLLGGSSGVGAEAARSHTAAVSPDGKVFREICHIHGAAFVRSDRELVEATIGLATIGASRGPRVGIVTGSGGAGVVATDLLSEAGMTVPTLSTDVQSRIASLLPDFASSPNPIDVTASMIAETEVVTTIATLLADSGEVDAVLVVGQTQNAEMIRDEIHGRVPVVFAMLEGSSSTVKPYLGAGLPVFPGLESTCTVLTAAARCGPTGERTRDPVSAGPPPIPSTPAFMDTVSSMELVDAAGVPVARFEHVTHAADVIAAGDSLGWPIVLKANLPAEAHKALSGGVRLGVSRAAARQHAEELLRLAPSLVVAEQLRGGPELVVGVRKDRQLGRVIVAGLGGGHVELLNRVVTLPANASAAWVEQRLHEEIFAGAGDRYACLPPQLAAVASQLVDCATAGDYDLVECNPLLPTQHGLIAVDARVLTPGELDDEAAE